MVSSLVLLLALAGYQADRGSGTASVLDSNANFMSNYVFVTDMASGGWFNTNPDIDNEDDGEFINGYFRIVEVTRNRKKTLYLELISCDTECNKTLVWRRYRLDLPRLFHCASVNDSSSLSIAVLEWGPQDQVMLLYDNQCFRATVTEFGAVFTTEIIEDCSKLPEED